jgi:molecular chaperone DnaJ
LQEIKRSFRQLALKYHPDKNGGSSMATAQFREIQEAYEVLSDPKQREAYNYQRWYMRSTGQSYAVAALTPAAILQESRALQQYVASLNVFHIPYEAVSRHIRELLSNNAIGVLQEYKETGINREIIRHLLSAAQALPPSYFQPITALLLSVAGNDQEATAAIAQAIRQKKQQHAWDQYKWLVVLVVTVLICWLMYWYGK